MVAFRRDEEKLAKTNMKYRIDKENQVQTNANANENEPNVPPPLLAEIFKALRPHPEACAAVECLLAQHLGQTPTNPPKPPQNP